MANLKTLAGRLGLSITTVSRALDGYGDVAEKTRRRVHALARELNYQPNAAARSLRQQKSGAVAVTLPAETSPAGVSGLFNILVDASTTLAAAGLDLLVVPTPSAESELASLRRLVVGRRVDAAILVRTRRNDPRVALLEDAAIPFVTHGRTASRRPHAYVDGDGEQGFRDAARMLIDLGHRSIAHVAAPRELMFARLRRKGWIAAMKGAGLSAALEAFVASPTEAEGHAAAKRLLAAEPRPTALLCATDTIAIGALAAAKEAGLHPGSDITIVGHDGLAVGAFSDPPLTTMQIDANDVGQRLAAILLERMRGTDPRELQIVLPVRQVLRSTHGPPSRRSARPIRPV